MGCLLLTLSWQAAIIPGVGSHVNLLSHLRPDSDLVPCALSTAPGLDTIGLRGVVELQEVVVLHVRGVEVGAEGIKLLLEVLNTHEEQAVLLVFFQASLCYEFRGPALCVVVAPLALVRLGAPRVPDLDEAHADAQLLDTDDSECVALDQAITFGISIGPLVGASGRACGDDVSGLVVLLEHAPDLVGSHLLVLVGDVRRASHDPDSVLGVATDDMLVVAVQLGEGFLEESRPQGTIVTRLGEEGDLLALLVCSQGQEVIDDDSVGHVQFPELDSVDALLIQSVVFGEEDFFHAAGELSDGRSACEEPAVAEGALIDIVSGYAISEEGSASRGEHVVGAGPRDVARLRARDRLLTHVLPEEGAVVRLEDLVCVAFRACEDGRVLVGLNLSVADGGSAAGVGRVGLDLDLGLYQ